MGLKMSLDKKEVDALLRRALALDGIEVTSDIIRAHIRQPSLLVKEVVS